MKEIDSWISQHKKIIEARITRLINELHLERLGLTHFYIAGSSLRPNEKINDWDLYPVSVFSFVDSKEYGIQYFHKESKNAETYYLDGEKIQLCKIYKSSLKEIIEEYDFSHVKLGCQFAYNSDKKEYEVVSTYLSDDYIKSVIVGQSDYVCGKTHPMDSMIRAFKYYERKEGLINPFIVVKQIFDEFLKRYKGEIAEEVKKPEPKAKDVGTKDFGTMQS